MASDSFCSPGPGSGQLATSPPAPALALVAPAARVAARVVGPSPLPLEGSPEATSELESELAPPAPVITSPEGVSMVEAGEQPRTAATRAAEKRASERMALLSHM